MPPAHARRCRPAGLPAGSAGAAVPSYRLPRCRAAAGTPGPAWVRLVTRTAGISRARAPAPLPPPCRRTLNPGPPHPGPDQATMELSPGLLLLFLAALLPLAAWSGPTSRPAGKQEPGTGECARARTGDRDAAAAAATRCSPLPCVVPGAGRARGCGRWGSGPGALGGCLALPSIPAAMSCSQARVLLSQRRGGGPAGRGLRLLPHGHL